MVNVTLSDRCQATIPREIRETLDLKPGQQMQVIRYNGHVELVPTRDMASVRGFLKDMDTEVLCEIDRV